MSVWFLLMAIVVVPCVLTIGVLVGYGRGRHDAERDLAATFL